MLFLVVSMKRGPMNGTGAALFSRRHRFTARKLIDDIYDVSTIPDVAYVINKIREYCRAVASCIHFPE